MDRKFTVLFFLLILSRNVFCQEDSTQRTKPKITPFIAPIYAQEVKLMIVAGGILTFQTGTDSDTKRSSTFFNLGWSTNDSKEVDIRPVIYSKMNNMRFFGRFQIKDMPDHYFGVGYNNGRNKDKTDSTTAYHRMFWQTDINILHRIRGNWFGGIRLDFNKTNATELSAPLTEDLWIKEQGTQVQNSGVGVIIQFDSRDFEVNASNGILLNFTGTFYGEPVSSDYTYRMYVFDYRQFKTVLREGSVLAWEFKIQYGSGNISWPELASLGSPFDLRGYRLGQYRDKTTGFGLLEYRHTFRRMRHEDQRLSRHRLVLWAGAGSLAERIDKWTSWLPNFGFGYRFEVQPSINVRLDFGIGVKAFEPYFNFNEAF